MSAPPATLPLLSAELSVSLSEFARACKAAIRAVSLYPPAHPAIVEALARLAAANSRLLRGPDVTLTIVPDTVTIAGRAAAREDGSIAELAALLHGCRIGSLRITRDAGADDWLALLTLLAHAPGERIAVGGIANRWAATGRRGFEIGEIDYAEILRERAGGDTADWDRIVEHCLRTDTVVLDERAIAALLEALGDPERFGQFIDRLQRSHPGGASIGARAEALLRLLRAAMETTAAHGDGGADVILDAAATAAGRLTPEMLLALLEHRSSGSPEHGQIVDALLERMTDHAVATFVAESVVAQRGATARLARAFGALVADAERQSRVLDLARDEARAAVSGDAAFDELWRRTREMLTAPPSPGAAAEATSEDAEARAIDLDRVPEDPPERIDGWLQTIAEPALRQLDLALLLDLLRVEDRPRTWRSLAMLVTAEIERRLVLCDLDAARQLAAALAATVADPTCAPLHDEARDALERLATGPLVPRVVTLLAAVDEDAVAPIVSLCHTVGALLVHPFAEALAIEENVRAVRRLREMLLGFGAAGRVAVEQLQSSPNPMVRRTAVDLLRVFGGHDALPELATMLDDPDPQVQREAIRAIVQIATPQAHAIVERVLVVGGAARRTAIDELIALGDDKSIPLLCYLLAHTHPRGALARAHAEVAEALGQLSAHPDTIAALGAMLRAADWWAPLRTAMLRRTAAAALSRIGTADALAMLELAANRGPRGARRIARACLQRRSGQP